MRRAGIVLIMVFALVLVAPMIVRRAMRVGSSVGGQATSDIPALVVINPHNQDIRREFAAVFSSWHQKHYGTPAALDFRSVGGSSDIIRALQNTYDAWRDAKTKKLPPESQINVDYDVAWGGGDYTFNKLKGMGILLPLDAGLVKAAIPMQTLSGVELYSYESPTSSNIVWAGVCLSSFGIVYNPDLLVKIGIAEPTRWDDLALPSLRGRIALADPSHSGSAGVAYMMVLQRAMADGESHMDNYPRWLELSKRKFDAERDEAVKIADPKQREEKVAAIATDKVAFLNLNHDHDKALANGWKTGMGRLLLIAANARYFTDSGERVPTDVGNGDAAEGMAIDFYGRMEQSIVGEQRAKFVAPANATAVTPDPAGILYGAKHLELARHFVEFLLSPEAQLLWIKKAGTPGGPVRQSLGRPPIRPELYADQTDWSDRVNPYADAARFNQRGAWMAMLGDLTKLWAASWIDDRDELQSAYQRILAVPDATHRQKLLNKLANIPFELADLNKAAAERKKLAAEGKADMTLWEARLRRDWAEKFREFYQSLADEAGNN